MMIRHLLLFMKGLKNIMNKKGDLADYIRWIWRIIMLILVSVSLWMIKERAVTKMIDTHGLEFNLLFERVLYSPNGIIYVDADTNRAYPGIIDISKFNEDSLNRIFQGGSKFAFRLKLNDKIIYYNEEFFNDAEPLLPLKYKKIERNEYVLVYENSKTSNGLLNIFMVYEE